METKKAEFLQAIANAGCYSYALRDLLSTASGDHFSETMESAIKDNESQGNDKLGGAYWWMNDHYSSVAAILYAAELLAESLQGITEDLYHTACGLVPDTPQKA